ncbi:hypothetical protein A33M_0374 [Rhodovulum sp. PH10]|nr:hypothetical protein A33M_0374 [Rhodovulum sp. PH10]
MRRRPVRRGLAAVSTGPVSTDPVWTVRVSTGRPERRA